MTSFCIVNYANNIHKSRIINYRHNDYDAVACRGDWGCFSHAVV